MQPGVYRFLLATFLLWTCFTQAQAKETDVPALGQVKPSGKIANPALPVKTDTDSAAKAEEEIARRILELEKRQLAQLREIELRDRLMTQELELRKFRLANGQKLVDWLISVLALPTAILAIGVQLILARWQKAQFAEEIKRVEYVVRKSRAAHKQAAKDLAYVKQMANKNKINQVDPVVSSVDKLAAGSERKGAQT